MNELSEYTLRIRGGETWGSTMVQSMPLFIFFNIDVCRMYRSMLEYAITISRRMLKKLVPVFAAGRRTESLGVRSGREPYHLVSFSMYHLLKIKLISLQRK